MTDDQLRLARWAARKYQPLHWEREDWEQEVILRCVRYADNYDSTVARYSTWCACLARRMWSEAVRYEGATKRKGTTREIHSLRDVLTDDRQIDPVKHADAVERARAVQEGIRAIKTTVVRDAVLQTADGIQHSVQARAAGVSREMIGQRYRTGLSTILPYVKTWSE
jgi:hypothetical protein